MIKSEETTQEKLNVFFCCWTE